MTLDELIDKLVSQYDVEDLCDMLDISSEDLLDRFDDKVAEHYDRAKEAIEE